MSAATPAGGPTTAGRSWPVVLDGLLSGRDQSAEDTAWAMDRILRGEATDAQIAGFAVALRAKGETVEEIAGLVRTMYEHANTIEVPGPPSTSSAPAATAPRPSTSPPCRRSWSPAPAPRSSSTATGRPPASGASDVLEKLGVNLELTPRRVAEVAEEAGITFCFAVRFHPALRHVAAARKELGIRTTFNFLGPLTNPARVRAQATGVADARMAPIMAGVLAERGSSALVFRGDDGLDELTTTATSRVWVVRDGAVREEAFDPGTPASASCPWRRCAARTPRTTPTWPAGCSRGDRPGARRGALNSAAALTALAPGDGTLAEQIRAGVDRAAEAIDSGAARRALERWIAVSNA